MKIDMKAEEFIKSIKVAVHDETVSSVFAELRKPAGRKPTSEKKELSDWFNSLDETDQQRVMLIIKETSSTAVFGLLCLFDGVRALNNNNTDRLKISVISEDSSSETKVHDGTPPFLHDLFLQEL
jgi:hypothetical protein